MKNFAAGILIIGAACLAALRAQTNGIAPEWDIGKTLTAIAADADRLAPYLEQLQPQQWLAKGAPDAYVSQWKQCQIQTKAVAVSARTLSRNPDKLTDQLELLFRLGSLEHMLVSLGEGVRRYQNPAVADLLHGVMAEGTANREKLQQYIFDLASEREQQFRVADSEAQRCRGFLMKQPTAAEKK
ncbi:MAG: hypothetical protein HYX25_06565 [Candidatus Solibacter usitatus]|nr:hypothetical protein [Candidatus Solibacter usitatus]